MTNNTAERVLATIVAVKNIKGTSFVGVRNYTNKEGEVSNQTFVVGFDYQKMLQNDLNKLKSFDLSKIEIPGVDGIDITKAYFELVASLEKRLSDEETKSKLLAEGDSTIKASKAQKDAYTSLVPGLKTQDGALYIYGLMVRKTVIKPVEYKAVKSQAKTIAKKTIKKAAGLQETKYKMFKLGNLEELKITGLTI